MSNRWALKSALLATLMFPMAATAETAEKIVVAPFSGPVRADVNKDYVAGQVALDDVKTPTLDEMLKMQAPSSSSSQDQTDEDKLRGPAIRENGLSYGAKGGLAWASKAINRELQQRAASLSKTYDFTSFLINGPHGSIILPPVIVESEDTYEQFDSGKALRIADTYYEIVAPARFAPTAPLWHAYLLRTFTAPSTPPETVLPKNERERSVWKTAVSEGWAQGVKQAQDIFQYDLRRLERDFQGMVRYSVLLEQKQVSAPIISDANFGITGSGENMRVNDRAMKITAPSRLNVSKPDEWDAMSSTLSKTEAATPIGAAAGRRDR